MSDRLHRFRQFLDEHPVIRWFAIPLVFMGSVITAVLMVFANATTNELAQIVGLFLVLSDAVVALGLGVERALKMGFTRNRLRPR
ncbi:hypothetical protein ACT9NR_16215 [Natrialba aegyptia]|nr:hypothetical protein [Natrialba aegyptia]